jgi:hypothetical protein
MKISEMNLCQELAKLANKSKKFMMMSLKILKDVIMEENIMLYKQDHKFESNFLFI